MKDHREFWQRSVTDELVLELVPGEKPCLVVHYEDQERLRLEFAEARALIEALTVAVGELLILKKDPSALSQLQRLLAEDVTLNGGEKIRPPVSEAHKSTEHLKAQELIRRYRLGERDFSKANLRGIDLQGADLRKIDLRGADLTGANLKRANLFRADLAEANLSQVNLEEAGLFQTNLRGADLSGANLHRAYMSDADLVGATVEDGQLFQALALSGAVLPDGLKHV